MKKVISLMLTLLICFGFAGCKTKENVPTDPLLGKWEAFVEGRAESIFEFKMQEDGVLGGTWTIYDYVGGSWSEHKFTVKSKTDTILTLLLDDGTLSTIPYSTLGHQMHIGGRLYVNSARTIEDAADTKGLMLHNGSNYEIAENIYLGINYESLKVAYPNIYMDDSGNYSGYTNYKVDHLLGKYTYGYFKFYENRLCEVRISIYDNEISYMNSFIEKADAQFGQHTFRQENYDEYQYDIHNEYDIYEWKLEEYRSIELEACTYVGETQLAWVSVTYS